MEQVTWSVLFILSLFVCVILHEFGHALAARRYHIQTKNITFYPIGGVASLEKMPVKPVQELIVALAGPAPFFFIFFGFFNSPFLVFIGLFVFLGAMAEAELVKNESILKGRSAEDFVMKQVPSLQTTDTVGKAVETLLNGQSKNFLVLEGNTPAGTLNRDGMIRALLQSGGETLFHSAMDKNLGFIEASESAEKAFMLMQQHKYPLLVVTKDNQLYGVIDMENILEYIMVMNASSVKNSSSVPFRRMTFSYCSAFSRNAIYLYTQVNQYFAVLIAFGLLRLNKRPKLFSKLRTF